jgi:hypothetical protein
MLHYIRMKVSNKMEQREGGDLSLCRAFLSLKLEQILFKPPDAPYCTQYGAHFVIGSWIRCLEVITDFVQQHWPAL